MTVHRIAASWLIPDAAAPAAGNRVITIADGRIAAVEDGAGKGGLVLPALASAHDHARVARLSQVGSFDVPLEAWLPYLTLIPAVDAWLARFRGRLLPDAATAELRRSLRLIRFLEGKPWHRRWAPP